MTSPSEHVPTRQRCGMPCLTHPHDCDRSPRHTGVHRDVQQKGDHSCEWDTPSAKDVPALIAEVKQLRTDLFHMTVARDVFAQFTKDAETERDRLAEQRDKLLKQVAVWKQRIKDNGDYYNATGAMYEHGKAVVYDELAHQVEETFGVYEKPEVAS